MPCKLCHGFPLNIMERGFHCRIQADSAPCERALGGVSILEYQYILKLQIAQYFDICFRDKDATVRIRSSKNKVINSRFIDKLIIYKSL